MRGREVRLVQFVAIGPSDSGEKNYLKIIFNIVLSEMTYIFSNDHHYYQVYLEFIITEVTIKI